MDSFDQSVEAFSSFDSMSKYVLDKMGLALELGMDPIEQVKSALGNRGRVVGVSRAFDVIARSKDKQSQELAHKFNDAVNRLKKAESRKR